MSDPASYRTKEEVNAYKLQDPLETTKETILSKGFATQEDLDKMEAEILAEINASVEFAENSNYPDASKIFKDVYVEADYPFILD